MRSSTYRRLTVYFSVSLRKHTTFGVFLSTTCLLIPIPTNLPTLEWRWIFHDWISIEWMSYSKCDKSFVTESRLSECRIRSLTTPREYGSKHSLFFPKYICDVPFPPFPRNFPKCLSFAALQYSERVRTRAKAKQLEVGYRSLLVATGSSVRGIKRNSCSLCSTIG